MRFIEEKWLKPLTGVTSGIRNVIFDRSTCHLQPQSRWEVYQVTKIRNASIWLTKSKILLIGFESFIHEEI